MVKPAGEYDIKFHAFMATVRILMALLQDLGAYKKEASLGKAKPEMQQVEKRLLQNGPIGPQWSDDVELALK